MEGVPVIRSRSNAAVKQAVAVLAGKQQDQIALEGDRLISDALVAGLELELVLVADDREDYARALELQLRAPAARAGEVTRNGPAGSIGRLMRVDRELMDRISALTTSPGSLALCARPPEVAFAALEVTPRSLFLVVAGIADPGNLGALARSAEAAGATALVIIEGGASPWNAKALRGSMGSLLRLPVVRFSSPESALEALAAADVRQVLAATRGGQSRAAFDARGALALWIGSETGVAPAICAAFERISIPMAGAVESLNVTVAASVLLFGFGRVEEM